MNHMRGYYSFAEDYTDEVHIEELAKLMDALKASGALKPQMCRWRTRAVASEPVVQHNYWAGAVHFARASYRCGCWIEWRLQGNRDLELPPDSDHADEFEFAKAHLGPLEAEHACKIHGGPADCTPDDDDPWWTPARCVTYGGHHVDQFDNCVRCGEMSVLAS